MPVVKLNNFRKGLRFVLDHEGGYSLDPDDPGGETKWGICKRDHPLLDIQNLLPDEAANIYAVEYWLPSGCDDIDNPYCVVVFDTAVNCGVKRATNWFKVCKTIEQFIEARKQYYYNLINRDPVRAKYLRGWMNRLNDLKKFVEIELIEQNELESQYAREQKRFLDQSNNRVQK